MQIQGALRPRRVFQTKMQCICNAPLGGSAMPKLTLFSIWALLTFQLFRLPQRFPFRLRREGSRVRNRQHDVHTLRTRSPDRIYLQFFTSNTTIITMVTTTLLRTSNSSILLGSPHNLKRRVLAARVGRAPHRVTVQLSQIGQFRLRGDHRHHVLLLDVSV